MLATLCVVLWGCVIPPSAGGTFGPQVVIDTRLTLPDDGFEYLSLAPGRYRVELTAGPADINVGWSDAPCANRKNVTSYRTECHVTRATSLWLQNPAILGLGDPSYVQIRITKIGG